VKASVPIAIVPRYQLTTVDVAAVSMAITDSYSPNDHWRWLASLWRGCVGPDITIVLRGPGEGADGSGENWDSLNTGVEVRLQGERTVVVRLAKSGEIDEKALRRVGFEVEEYLRR
jgi:HMG box factor